MRNFLRFSRRYTTSRSVHMSCMTDKEAFKETAGLSLAVEHLGHNLARPINILEHANDDRDGIPPLYNHVLSGPCELRTKEATIIKAATVSSTWIKAATVSTTSMKGSSGPAAWNHRDSVSRSSRALAMSWTQRGLSQH